MKKLILLAVLGLSWCTQLFGATFTAASCSEADVLTAYNLTSNGDTLVIPAGTCTWSSNFTISKGITVQGNGVGSTIIQDDVQSGPLLTVSLVASQLTRLTGLDFEDGGRTSGPPLDVGVLHVGGSNTDGSQFRLDNSKWGNVNGSTCFDTVIGVIDHTSFTMDTVGTAIAIFGKEWNGDGIYGDGSWSAPTGFGTSQFLFIEDCTFVADDPTFEQIVTDAYSGARFVVRYNNITNARPTNHGTDSSGRPRGARAMEIYNNTFTLNSNKFVGGSRSGSCVFHDNTVSGTWANLAVFDMDADRGFFPFAIFGGADGTNVWDVNEAGTFFTGTAASNSSGTTVTVSGSPGWTTDQWQNYTVRRTTDVCSSGTLAFGYILNSGSNTLTYSDNGGFFIPTMTFCTGDSLEIRKVDHMIDQPGRALGSLLTGDNPTPPTGWNDQVTEPCYGWNNGAHSLFQGHTGVIEGIHYFNNTVMPGYSPYCYPHPLVSGVPCATPTATPTATATATATATPTATATATATATPTATATATATPCSTPPAPSSLHSTTITAGIGLAWTDNSSDEDGFYIERANKGITCGTFSQIGTVSSNVTTYNDTTATSGHVYCYRVRAHNCGGYSDYSNVISASH